MWLKVPLGGLGGRGLVQSQSNEEQWRVKGVFGQEIWTRREGRFVKAVYGETQLNLTSDEADLDLLWVNRTSTCQCSGPWPHEFRYCPQCGGRLEQRGDPPLNDVWCAPFGTSEGYGEFRLGLVPEVDSRADMVLPDHATLSFVVAGTPSRLFALDHSRGYFYRWVEGPESRVDGGRWAEHLRFDLGAGLPRWSWAAAASSSGLALPARSGPVWVSLLPDRPSVSVTFDDKRVEACLGGAARVGSIVAVPVRRAGTLALALWTGTAWTVLDVFGANAAAAQAVFAVPVTQKDDAHWVGEAGQLYLSNTAEGVSAYFLPWGEGFLPISGARPLLTADGTFYQMGRVNADTVKWEMLRGPNTPPGQFDAKGLALSCGTSVFQNGKRYARPWEKDDPLSEYICQDEFIMPLLGLDDNCYLLAFCPERRTLTSFVDTAASEIQAKKPLRLYYSDGTRRKEDMKKLINARNAWDVVCFIFSGHLFVYSACDNVGWRWRLV